MGLNFKKMVLELCAFAIYISCLPIIIRNTYAREKVSILIYHNPEKDILDRHFEYLSKRYNFITLDMLVNAIHSKNWSNIPPKSLIITVDDGFKENYYLLEIFKKYNVIPTIYICSQLVNTNRHYWWTKIDYSDKHKLQNCSNDDRLYILQKKYNFTINNEYENHERQALNIKEITIMKDYVEFQCHSRFHPILSNCLYEECEKEILQSKIEIERLINKKCQNFAYPVGKYSQREVEIVKQAGYLSARTCDIGWNNQYVDPYKLKAIGIADNSSIIWLIIQLSGIVGYMKLLREKIKNAIGQE